MTGFVNLTPHEITLFKDGVVMCVVPPSGTVARVSTVASEADDALGIPCQVKRLGDVVGLPAYGSPCLYLVSGLVLEALRQQRELRDDVAAPATGPDDGAVRNEKGHVVGVTRLDVLV